MKNRLFFLLLFLINKIHSQDNVILIIADDLGKDYCGFYADHGADTVNIPNIRSLVKNGVVFSNAWATPLCSPTRAGILTGRYSFRTSVGTVVSQGTGELDTNEVTIPRILKKNISNNYTCANIGKWHLNIQTPAAQKYPNIVGYDEFSGLFLGELPDYYSYTKVKNGTKISVNNYATTETINDALSWLNTTNNKPFFLWLAFNSPHSPYHKPPDSLYTGTLSGTTQDINQNPKKYFKAMTEAMDKEIGRLFSYLKSVGKWNNTQIIFIGDNGNAQRVAQISDTGKSKGTLYEYGINVPMIISGSKVNFPNRVSTELVNTCDIFATVCELAGENNWKNYCTKTVDAVSLMPYVLGQKPLLRNWIFSEKFSPIKSYEEGKTMRNKLYKLIRFDDGREELFNLTNDPGELNNLLKGKLTALDSNNYRYLCNEMGKLLGTNQCGLIWANARNVTWKNSLQLLNKNGKLIVQSTVNLQRIEVFNWQGKLIYNEVLHAKTAIINLQQQEPIVIRITSTTGEVYTRSLMSQ